jgi:hypothetical protein
LGFFVVQHAWTMQVQEFGASLLKLPDGDSGSDMAAAMKGGTLP